MQHYQTQIPYLWAFQDIKTLILVLKEIIFAVALKFRGVMIFSKSKAGNMQFDKKKSDITSEKHYMSGCNGMLPAMFDNIQPVARTMFRKEDKYIAHRMTQIWRINYYIQFRIIVRKE